MEGIFSLARDFNINDPKDCVLSYDMNKIRDQIYKKFGKVGITDYLINSTMKSLILKQYAIILELVVLRHERLKINTCGI